MLLDSDSVSWYDLIIESYGKVSNALTTNTVTDARYS